MQLFSYTLFYKIILLVYCFPALDNYNDVIASVNAETRKVKPDCMFIQEQAGVVHNIVNDNPDVVSLFAFTERVSIDTTNADGIITKTNVFKHQKFMKY